MQDNHVQALKRKHVQLEEQIRQEMKRPAQSDLQLRRMKERKLHLREEIDRHSKSAAH